MAQGSWGPAPLGKGTLSVYTASHGARLSSVPSGDQSANPASVPGRSSLQRALLSVSSAQKCSGAGRLATPSGVFRAARSAVPCRSSAPGHRASHSKYTRDQSGEKCWCDVTRNIFSPTMFDKLLFNKTNLAWKMYSFRWTIPLITMVILSCPMEEVLAFLSYFWITHIIQRHI